MKKAIIYHNDLLVLFENNKVYNLKNSNPELLWNYILDLNVDNVNDIYTNNINRIDLLVLNLNVNLEIRYEPEL